MSGYQIDPECPELPDMQDDFELDSQSREYDPDPMLSGVQMNGDSTDDEYDDCTD